MIPEKFQHILRVLNTNIDGRRNIMFALTSIKVKCANDSLVSIKIENEDTLF